MWLEIPNQALYALPLINPPPCMKVEMMWNDGKGQIPGATARFSDSIKPTKNTRERECLSSFFLSLIPISISFFIHVHILFPFFFFCFWWVVEVRLFQSYSPTTYISKTHQLGRINCSEMIYYIYYYMNLEILTASWSFWWDIHIWVCRCVSRTTDLREKKDQKLKIECTSLRFLVSGQAHDSWNDCVAWISV